MTRRLEGAAMASGSGDGPRRAYGLNRRLAGLLLLLLGVLAAAIVFVLTLSGAPNKPAAVITPPASDGPTSAVSVEPSPPVVSATTIPYPSQGPTETPSLGTVSPTAGATSPAGASPPATPPSAPTPKPSAAAPVGGWIGPELISTRGYGDLALTVDHDGVAHAAAVLNDSIYYLTNASGSWTRNRLSKPAGYDWEPSVALDSDRSIHIAFTRWPPDDPDDCPPDISKCFGLGPDGVYYVTNASGNWSEPVRLAGEGSNSASLQVRDGHVHVAYLASPVYGELSGPSEVRHKTNRSGTWADELVGWSYAPPALRLGSEGRVHLAFWDNELDDEGDLIDRPRLWYAVADRQTGSMMTEELPLSDAGWIGQLWLALDGMDRPHLMAEVWGEESEATDLWVMRKGRWTRQAILPDGGVRAMTVGADGTLHLLIVAGECCLQYLTNPLGVFESHSLSLDSGGGDIALDAHGRLHLLYVAGGHARELWYAIASP